MANPFIILLKTPSASQSDRSKSLSPANQNTQNIFCQPIRMRLKDQGGLLRQLVAMSSVPA